MTATWAYQVRSNLFNSQMLSVNSSFHCTCQTQSGITRPKIAVSKNKSNNALSSLHFFERHCQPGHSGDVHSDIEIHSLNRGPNITCYLRCQYFTSASMAEFTRLTDKSSVSTGPPRCSCFRWWYRCACLSCESSLRYGSSCRRCIAPGSHCQRRRA